MSLTVHQYLRAGYLQPPLPRARPSRFSRRALLARRADGGVARVCRNFSACTYSSEEGRVTMSASRSDCRNSDGPLKSCMRIRTEPRPWATCESEPAPAGIRYLAAKRTAS